ncbi:MAG: Sulfate/thiosulfate import ATP-binding protein CysA [bacterium]|nr:Sulfate/thiosulfate import ATP-binding protein CysA [bacterium]
MSIQVRDITKTFGAFTALRDVTLEVPPGDLLALLGPSGSGKTTLLRIISGLEVPDSGQVLVHGEDVTDQPLRDRRVGFVFQHYALFRHMTVFENVAFGLRVRPRAERPSKAEIRERVMRLLQLVQLEQLTHRYPSQLSGGQRQRVALARALAVEPKILLLDEPFGALDAKVRKELRTWLRRLHDEIHVTSVFVTHDQEEALEVADRVVIMNEGRIEQVGSPEEVYHHPKTPFVYNFLGNVNLFHSRVENGKAYLGNTLIEVPKTGIHDSREAKVFIRPHLLNIERSQNGRTAFGARILHLNPAGPMVKVELETEWGDNILVELSQDRYRTLGLRKEEYVYVSPKEFQVYAEDYSI